MAIPSTIISPVVKVETLTDRAEAAGPVGGRGDVEGQDHVDRRPAGLVGVLSPAGPGVVVVGVRGDPIGHHQPPLLPPHPDHLLVVDRGQALVTLPRPHLAPTPPSRSPSPRLPALAPLSPQPGRGDQLLGQTSH